VLAEELDHRSQLSMALPPLPWNLNLITTALVIRLL
jgi:hypothetical protein